MTTKIICDRCKCEQKKAVPRIIETKFKTFRLDLCKECEENIKSYIKTYLKIREYRDTEFNSLLMNVMPQAKDLIEDIIFGNLENLKEPCNAK